MIFRDKVLLFAQPGALPQNVLEEIVKKARELDMEKVRAEVAKQQAGAQSGQAEEQAPQPT
jgi:thioredoxin 1